MRNRKNANDSPDDLGSTVTCGEWVVCMITWYNIQNCTSKKKKPSRFHQTGILILCLFVPETSTRTRERLRSHNLKSFCSSFGTSHQLWTAQTWLRLIFSHSISKLPLWLTCRCKPRMKKWKPAQQTNIETAEHQSLGRGCWLSLRVELIYLSAL